jgi:hypothetical protein
MSDAFYKNLELQMKEMGQAYWACLSFCNKMNTQIKEVDKRVDQLMGKLEENTAGLKKADKKIEKVKKAVGKVERRQEDSEKRIEESMCEEMRAREAIRRNVIVHGVPEPDSGTKTDKERTEADLTECNHIFKATGARIGRRDIRFCRRVGERGIEKRPLLVGLKTEMIKTDLLDAARELRHTVYKNVSICPDQTRKQRMAEKKLLETVVQKNREELTDEDRSKNLQWMAVGKKGEKRIMKGPAREEREYNVQDQARDRRGRRTSGERRWPSRERRGPSRERMRTNGEDRYREERRTSKDQRRGHRDPSREKSHRRMSKEPSRHASKEMSRERSDDRMDMSGGEDNSNKRGRGSGTESEEERIRDRPKKTKQ